MLYKKRMVAVMAFVCLIAATAQAQETAPGSYYGLSLGFSIEQISDDFAMGVRITSPYFLWNYAAATISASYVWREGCLDSNPAVTTWIPYWIFRAGLVGGTLAMGNGIRLYGYGGVLCVLPDPSFDGAQFLIGGYGGFGFEFLLNRDGQGMSASYFIELGSSGTGAVAELMVGDPIYVNGFSLTVGFKMYF